MQNNLYSSIHLLHLHSSVCKYGILNICHIHVCIDDNLQTCMQIGIYTYRPYNNSHTRNNIYIYVYIPIVIYTCMNMYTVLHIYTYVYNVCIYIYFRTHPRYVHTCTYTEATNYQPSRRYMYTHTHTHNHTRRKTHICIYLYIFIHGYTCIYIY